MRKKSILLILFFVIVCYANGFIGNGINSVSGNYSAILGGSGNNDGGLAWAGIFGCNITATISCALHANQLVAPNTLNTGLTFPCIGLIQSIPVTAGMIAIGFPAGSCVLFM